MVADAPVDRRNSTNGFKFFVSLNMASDPEQWKIKEILTEQASLCAKFHASGSELKAWSLICTL